MNKISELRKITGKTQKEFAESFDIPLKTLQNWEQGRNKAPEYTIKMISNLIKFEIIKNKEERIINE